VLTISFLSAGLIPLAQRIGIIDGANLGTTTGAWLVAGLGLKIDIAAYALPMLVFGVIMIFQKNHQRWAHVMAAWRSAGVWSCVAWVVVVLRPLPRPAGVISARC
jgi:Na+/phosphate symporter